MEYKSRVTKYEALRKEIAKMDSYSFEETSSQVLSHVDKKTSKISISADDLDALLLSEKLAKERQQKTEIKKKFKAKKKEAKKDHYMTQGKILVLVLIPCVLIIVTLLVLIFLGVI